MTQTRRRWRVAFLFVAGLVALPAAAKDEASAPYRKYLEAGEPEVLALIASYDEPRSYQALKHVVESAGYDTEFRARALWHLALGDPQAARELLLEASGDGRRELRLTAARALRLLGAEGREALVELARDKKSDVRAAAIESLGVAADPELEPTFLAALEDRSREVRDAALWALIPLGGEGARAAARDRIAHRDARVRLRAVQILALSETVEDLKRLAGLLGDPEQEVRRAAARALGASPHATRELLELALASTQDPGLRECLHVGLLDAGAGMEQEIIRTLLQDPFVCGVSPASFRDSSVLDEALALLGKGPDEAVLVAPLVGRIGGSRAAEALEERIAADQTGWSVPLVKALGKAGSEGAAALEELAGHGSERIREAAREALVESEGRVEPPEGSYQEDTSDEPHRHLSTILPPEERLRLEPWYPPTPTKGIVVIKATISKLGTVEEITAESSPDHRLSRSAVASVRGWLFRSGIKDGRLTDVVFTLTVRFAR